MPVHQRGGAWQADLNANRRRWRYAFATEDAARGWLADAQAAIANGRPVPEPDAQVHGVKSGLLTFARACDQCWAEVYGHVKSAWPATVLLYMQQMQKFWPHASIKDVARQSSVSEYTAHLNAAGGATSTINGKLSVLQRVLRWAYEHRHIDAVPKINRARVSNERMSYLSHEDEATIIRVLRQAELHDAADAVAVLIDTGLRQSELWRLTGRDVVEGQRLVINVRQSKNGNPRAIRCTSRAAEIIRRRTTSYKTEALFPGMTNRRLQLAWEKPRTVLGRLSDKEFIPYICRHTCASRLVQNGVPLGVVMKWMGHRSIQVTTRYAKHAPADFENAVAALDAKSNDAGPVAQVVPFVSSM